ncbi:TetR/AcrR family transcriptional regulator [Microbacterium terricola]|uniref:TetR family transcriptional regulator n=1 Tax=Microbacterium terricola TaxID=344163 RepID=A0ABM8DVD8_9MICO|nr:TetR/AcrR family transcriptional regulator [Microbacterium terricola]UYK39682.1 TetR/AcrR family transcriptional regulator [Microbacterium terricola]BDV29575.1 TetR family transcriptional regulator [Microbacterium terricola]
MTTEPGRPYHHGNLREALIATGLTATRESGSRAIVLRDIARRVGVSPNAVYRHFADRDALLAAVALRIQEGMVERMLSLTTAPAPGMTTARTRLHAVGVGYISFALAEPGWFEVAFAAPDALIDELPAPGELPPPLASLSSALDALVASGELAPAARPGAEWPCWSAVHGFALLALHGPLQGLSVEEVQAAAARTVDTVIAGLLRDDPRPAGTP